MLRSNGVNRLLFANGTIVAIALLATAAIGSNVTQRREFTGKPARSFQVALENAISAAHDALESESGADTLIEWEQVSVNGRHGGFVGFQDMTVTIRASVVGAEEFAAAMRAKKCSKCKCSGFFDFTKNGICDNKRGGPFSPDCGHKKSDHTRT